MPKSTNSQPVSKDAITLPEDLIPPPQLFPDEDLATYETLREMLFADLSPAGNYERLLAVNLVDLEWEALRHRRFRDHLIRAEFRDIAAEAFDAGEGGINLSLVPSSDDKDRAAALLSSDPERRAAAEGELAGLRTSTSELLARAYQRLSKDLEPHERKLAEIEVRRRRLREDFDRLKAARAKPVEDAEILAAE